MARDPFAPVTQPAIPPWVLPIAITVGLLFLGTAAVAVVVMVKKNAAPPVVAQPVVPAPTPRQDAAPDKDKPGAVAQTGTGAAADKEKPGPADEGRDEPRRRHHRGSSGAKKGAAAPPTATKADAPKPKKSLGMSQKEIDNLLGL